MSERLRRERFILFAAQNTGVEQRRTGCELYTRTGNFPLQRKQGRQQEHVIRTPLRSHVVSSYPSSTITSYMAASPAAAVGSAGWARIIKAPMKIHEYEGDAACPAEPGPFCTPTRPWPSSLPSRASRRFREGRPRGAGARKARTRDVRWLPRARLPPPVRL